MRSDRREQIRNLAECFATILVFLAGFKVAEFVFAWWPNAF